MPARPAREIMGRITRTGRLPSPARHSLRASMTQSYFLSGIGGSGMLPLAVTLRRTGAQVSGSDRAFDAAHLAPGHADKRDFLLGLGIRIAPQDGSGPQPGDTLVISAAVENTTPDVQRANALGLAIRTRAQVLSGLFNAAQRGVGVAGTSGKSTTTAMIGWALHACGADPTIVNGASMPNFAIETNGDARFASSVSGAGPFVAEVDESDGSIALWHPHVALVSNITLDHKPLPELLQLFSDFLRKGAIKVINLDDAHLRDLRAHLGDGVITYALHDENADWRILNASTRARGEAWMVRGPDGRTHAMALRVLGAHNASNALSAVAVGASLGLDAGDLCRALSAFAGVTRRLEMRARVDGVSVYDDFAHNPDKIATSLRALKDEHARVLCFFQPHGFRPMELMHEELFSALRDGLSREDVFWTCDPLYLGGTTQRNDLARALTTRLCDAGLDARFLDDRAMWPAEAAALARPGDAVVLMGARDDTLTALCDAAADALRARHGTTAP